MRYGRERRAWRLTCAASSVHAKTPLYASTRSSLHPRPANLSFFSFHFSLLFYFTENYGKSRQTCQWRFPKPRWSTIKSHHSGSGKGWSRVYHSELQKKKVIESSVVRDGLIFLRRSRLKIACLEIIRSLAFNVIRQRASKPPLVPKTICEEFGSSGIVLEEATSACDRILLTQLRSAHGMAPESEAAYYDCQPSTLNLISLCHTSGLTTIIAIRTSNNNSAYREKCEAIDTNNKNKAPTWNA